MSVRALLRGVETRLRSAAVLDDPDGKRSGIQPLGKPPASMGQIYYAAWWGGARARQDHTTVEHTDTDHGVNVTITARVGYSPRDRRGQVISDPNELLDLAEALAAPGVLHGSYAVLASANALVPGTAEYLSATGGNPALATANGFVEPLWLLDYGPVEEKNPDWVGAEAAGDGEDGDVFAVVVRFWHARRLVIG